jgi:hypothetical protein
MTAPRERRMAVILPPDVVGYGRLMEADEAVKRGRLEFVEGANRARHRLAPSTSTAHSRHHGSGQACNVRNSARRAEELKG